MRQALTIILPLLAPALIYIWLKSRGTGSFRIAAKDAPWVWLAGAGVVLAAVVLSVWGLTSGGPTESTYKPAVFKDGQVVPGEVVPKGEKQP